TAGNPSIDALLPMVAPLNLEADANYSAHPPLARAEHSRYVQRVRRRYGQELAQFAQIEPGVPRAAAINQMIDELLRQGRPLATALRVTRQMVIERLATLDVEQHALLGDVTSAM